MRILSTSQQLDNIIDDIYKIVANKIPVVSNRIDCPKDDCLVKPDKCLRCKYNIKYEEGDKYDYIVCSYSPQEEEDNINEEIIQISKKYKKAMYKYNKKLLAPEDVPEQEVVQSKVRRTSFGSYSPEKMVVRKIGDPIKSLEHSEFVRQALLDERISQKKLKEIKRKEEWEREAQKAKAIANYYGDVSSVYRNKIRRISVEDPKKVSWKQYDITSSDRLIEADRKFKEERLASIKRESCAKESVNDISVEELKSKTLKERFLNSDVIKNLLNMAEKSS